MPRVRRAGTLEGKQNAMTYTQYEGQPARSGVGCWLTMVITLFIAGVLVLVGLFLPPFSLYDRLFGVQYATLARVGDSIATRDGSLRLIVAEDGAGYGAAVDGISLREFMAADADAAAWVAAARSSVPAHLALQSAVYTLQTDARTPSPTFVSVAVPNNARANLLDLYAYDEVRQQWQFVPSVAQDGRIIARLNRLPSHVALFQTIPLAPQVLVTYDVTQLLTPDVASVATIVAPSGLQPTVTGALTGSLAPGFVQGAGYRVMPMLRDYADPRALDTFTVEAILSNIDLRREHVRQITSLVGGGFDGVFIDYRGLATEQRDNFSAFIRELGQSFKRVGMQLGVVVPAAEIVEEAWSTGAYDWQAIGQYADYVQINLGIAPATFQLGSNQLVEAMLAYAVQNVSRYKLLMGLSAQSVREIGDIVTRIGYDEALAGLGNVVVEADNVNENGIVQPGSVIRARLNGLRALNGVDMRLNAPYLDYLNDDGSVRARMWLTTADALRYRMDVSVPFALGGVAFDDLLANDLAEDVLDAVRDYRAQIPSLTVPTALALRWRIEGTNGLLEEVVTEIGEELVTTLNAPDGNYAVNVAVIAVGQRENVSVRSGAAVAMFSPTATPTPLPTATPTPTPTNTPTPVPIVATARPANAVDVNPQGGGFSAVAPNAGSIRVGQFEYGGQVTDAGSGRAIDAMRRAGMTWMKIQKRYYAGVDNDIGVIAGSIGAARSNGFKILISVVGNPNDLRNGGDGYIAGFSNFLATIASLAPDAIEVWNEPNLDREWPAGQISGANYTNMLKQAYSAIKRTNASVMVISAALAPTGAEAAYPDRVVNDDRFLMQMVQAGALSYADCIGVHYNEGIVPPTATSGDPRGDNYYTRYLPTMVERYWSIIGGQKPLCFTELGYLSPEGFGFLDPYFGWAGNTTVAQHAAWLAQAAALLSQSGKVRLLIVWNVDFSYYGTDPMAGYAIIRPDGSCPACDALANAR